MERARLGVRPLVSGLLLLLAAPALAVDPPVLDTSTCATSANPCVLTGTAPAASTVTMYVEGDPVGTVSAHPTTGVFSFSAPLYDGWNDVDATATVGGDTSTGSNVLTLEYVNGISRTQGGTISVDTVWTPGSPATPYTVPTTDLTIASGKTLILQPGTTIKFANSRKITVNGKLWVRGTASSQVVLTSSNASPARGNWAGIVVAASSVGTTIEQAKIEWVTKAITVSGATSIAVADSTLREFSQHGIDASSAASLTVAGCTIDQSAGTKAGIGISLSANVATIVGNLIKKATTGILLTNSSPSITGNTIQDGTYGISVQTGSSPSITGANVVTANNYGVYVQGNGILALNPNPVVNGNQIYANTTDDYFATTMGNDASTTIILNAEGNWWGSTDPAVIADNIRDATEAQVAPVVDFTPFLGSAGGVPVSGTYLNGVIPNGSTIPGVNHQVVGTLRVPAGSTATIAAGATLRFVPGTLFEVDGTLLVQGANGSLVVMTSAASSPTRNSWLGLRVDATSSGTVLDYLKIEHAGTALDAYASFTIRNSTIREFSSIGIFVRSGVVATIEANTIDNTAGTKQGSGIHVDAAGAATSIAGNLIQGVVHAIYVSQSSPSITGNTARLCNYGVNIQSGASPSVTGNVFTENLYGVNIIGAAGNPSLNPNPVVTGNQIFANTTWDLFTSTYTSAAITTTLNVSGNWWGTADPIAISDAIHDQTDYPETAPTIGFTPFLDGPGGAPVAGTYLNGTIPSGTTLTAAAPYQVVGSIRVPAGGTVTIDPDAVLRFVPEATVQVDGTLLVAGTAGHHALLTSLEPSPARGDWEGIKVNAGSTGSIIEHATVEYATYGVNAYAGVTVRDSTLREVQTAGVFVRASVLATIDGNLIDNSAGTKQGQGIYLDQAAAGNVIAGNTIRKFTGGIQLSRSSPSVTANDVRDCTYGINVLQQSAPLVTSGNVFTANTYGVYVQGTGQVAQNPNPLVNGNQIHGNATDDYFAASFGNASTTILNAEANYWGTTVSATIASNIRDFTESALAPTVDFTPFLDANGLPVGGGSYLSGTLSGTTTLTSGSPYEVVGTVTVSSGATLTIQSGAVLHFALDTKINVQGTLEIQGTSGSPVLLTSSAATKTRTDWDGIVVLAGSAGVTIDHATIEYVTKGIDAYAAFTVRDSTIREFQSVGIDVRPTVVATIESNTIDNSAGQKQGNGIFLDTAGAGTTIDANLIKKTSTGIYILRSSPAVTGNTIQDGSMGIQIGESSSPTVTGGNVITANSFSGIQVLGTNVLAKNPAPVINGNSIYSNTMWDLSAYAFGSTAAAVAIDAQNNWWGSANAAAIAANVDDHRGDPKSPVVDWTPYLDASGGSPVAGSFVDRPISATTALTTGTEYLVTSKITVASGAIFTIPADVTLRFVPDASLQVAGTLAVQGTSADPVLFTSAVSPPARGDWNGVYVHPASTGTDFEYAIFEFADIGVDVDGATVTIDDCVFRQFWASGAGISLHDGAYATIDDTLVDNTQIATKQGYGIEIIDASATITDTTVQGAVNGIWVQGDSAPAIGAGTVLTANTRGVVLQGTGQLGGPQPNPTIHGASLYGNTSGNVLIQNFYNPSGAASLDFTGNWWGTATPTGVAATISQASLPGSASAQVDFSDFLDGPGGTPIIAARFLNVLHQVTRSTTIFQPSAPESVSIGFTLVLPATVTLTICLETDTSCATPVRTFVQAFGAGTHSIVWDGKNGSANYVADEAYSYKLAATDGVADGINEGLFDPPRPTAGPGIGTLQSMTPQFNAHRNQGVLFTFTLPSPQRLTLQSNSTAIRPSRPYLAGPHEILWDGRDAAGNLVTGAILLNLGVQTPLKTNIVIVEGTEPRIFGIGATPLVEVKSNPYLVIHSYEQIANVTYRIDQDCYVTVKLLPPGVNDFASASAVVMTPTTLLAAATSGTPNDHVSTWTGYVPASPREAYFADEGTYTFAIQATSATTGLSALYRGALQLRR